MVALQFLVMGETVQDTGRGPDSVPWEMMVNTVIEEVGREGALINRARHPVETPSVL